MGKILIFFRVLFFGLTLISNYFDLILQFQGKREITQLGQLWFYLGPNSLLISETVISRYLDPCSALEILNCNGFIWHPFISTILLFTAAPFLAFLSCILISFGIKRTRSKGFAKGKQININKN